MRWPHQSHTKTAASQVGSQPLPYIPPLAPTPTPTPVTTSQHQSWQASHCLVSHLDAHIVREVALSVIDGCD